MLQSKTIVSIIDIMSKNSSIKKLNENDIESIINQASSKVAQWPEWLLKNAETMFAPKIKEQKELRNLRKRFSRFRRKMKGK